jgi:hypothetical protein
MRKLCYTYGSNFFFFLPFFQLNDEQSQKAINFTIHKIQIWHSEFDGTLDDYIFNELERKMETYEKWYHDYPGYGGFLRDGFLDYENFILPLNTNLLNQWISPGNCGNWVWTLIAAGQVLEERGDTASLALAARYQAYVEILAENVLYWFDTVDNRTAMFRTAEVKFIHQRGTSQEN